MKLVLATPLVTATLFTEPSPATKKFTVPAPTVPAALVTLAVRVTVWALVL